MKIYSLAFLLLFLYPFTASIKDGQQKLNKNKPIAANIVFKSIDGGQTWQDISEGLPENLKEELWTDDFFADDNGLHLRAYKNGIYHNKLNSTSPFWEREPSPHEQGSLAGSKSGMFAFNDNGQFLYKKNGTSVWSSMHKNFPVGVVRTVFETAGGTIFVGRDYGLWKSDNRGRSWKNVLDEGYVVVTDLVESDGVLIGAGRNGILRSTDNGEHWQWVINEGGIGKSVASINGGFAAISYDPQTGSDRIRTSFDKGKTWKAIDAGLPAQVFNMSVDKPFSQVNPNDSIWHPINTSLPAQLSIASIIEVDKNLFCGHSAGIYRSSDKGKTWKLLLPSIDNKVFNLFVSGNVIYAIPLSGGC